MYPKLNTPFYCLQLHWQHINFKLPEKSAAQIPTLMKIDTMFFVHLPMTNARFRTRCCVYVCKTAIQAQEETLATTGMQRYPTPAAAAKPRSRQEDDQQRDSRLALARLAHFLASKYHCGAIKVLCMLRGYEKLSMEPSSPLVFASTGGMARECTICFKRIADILSDREKMSFSQVLHLISCHISFALLRSAIRNIAHCQD